MNPIPEELGQTARNVVGVMKESPLSLALVLVNVLLVGLLFYTGRETLAQRTAISKLIVEQQMQLQPLLAGCVSAETMKVILDKFTPRPHVQPPTAPDPAVSGPR
jgi:uncharacterized membrane protein affecting hemolysin expression